MKRRKDEPDPPSIWDRWFKSMGQMSSDFMEDGRNQPKEQQVREGLDDLFSEKEK